MALQIQKRHDTAANWTSVNPVLALAEDGYETDTGKWKTGNGSSTWSALSYASSAGSALVPAAVKSSAYVAAAGDLVPVDTTSSAVTVTLPTAPADKAMASVKLIAGANAVTIAAGGSDVFNKTSGSTSLTLTLVNQTLTLQYKASGAIWYVVSGDLPITALTTSLNGTYGPAVGSDSWLVRQVIDPGDRLTGTITRNGNGAATSATFRWDDGLTGAYTGTVFNATFLGKVDAWTVTYIPATGPTRTVTQPTMTRDASGAVTARPALTVA